MVKDNTLQVDILTSKRVTIVIKSFPVLENPFKRSIIRCCQRQREEGEERKEKPRVSFTVPREVSCLKLSIFKGQGWEREQRKNLELNNAGAAPTALEAAVLQCLLKPFSPC